MKIVNFGSLNIDYTYRVNTFVQPGETKACHDRSINCGGKGLNQSIALAQAGAEVYHAGFVGSDGAFLVERLQKSGVNTEFVRPVQASNGHAVIQVNSSGQNCILLYPGTNHMLTLPYIDEVLDRFQPGDIVVLQNETNRIEEIMLKAAARGLLIAFNAAPMNQQVEQYPLEKVKWLFVNEIEGAALSGQSELNQIVRSLAQRWKHSEIILTAGKEGCIYANAEKTISMGACNVKPVDTTGAGDTFVGFFLQSILKGYNEESALQIATVASAIAVTRPGAADAIPHWSEVEALLPRYANELTKR